MHTFRIRTRSLAIGTPPLKSQASRCNQSTPVTGTPRPHSPSTPPGSKPMVNTDPNYIAPITTDTRGNPLTGAVIQNYDPNAPIGSSATMTYPNAPSSNLTTAADSTPPAVITSDPARTQVTQAVTGLNDELTKMGTGYATGDPNAQKTTTTETKQPTDTATTSTQIQPTGDPQF